MVRKALFTLLAAAFVTVPTASAKPSAPPARAAWAPGVEISYTETVRDASGNVIGQNHRDGIAAGQVFGSADRANSSRGSATAIDPGSNLGLPTQHRMTSDCCSPGGSDTVDFTVTKHTLLGFVAWRYHQVDHWCWSYPSITCLSVGAGFYDVDGQNSVNYDSDGYGWYYGWSGSAQGGHYAYRQGSISNCIFRYGCLSTSYPYVEIWLNGNGAWAADGGGN